MERMQKERNNLFLVLAMLFAAANMLPIEAQAQTKAKFKFEEETFDFGSIKEENGPVEHKFVFTNEGNAPLIIQGVQASCGCTTPAWSKEPIPPGVQGFIRAKYNPKNRPGSFRKSLSITSNAETARKVIYIKGVVEKKQISVVDRYRYRVGDIWFKYQSFNMGKVITNQPITRLFEFYNNSENAITFQQKIDAPDYVTISFQPEKIEPKGFGKLVITYDGKGKNDLGRVFDPIKIYTDEEADSEKTLRVVATIEEYFPPMTAEQRAQAAKLTFEGTTHDFGSMQKNDVVETEFVFTNTGKSPLNIRKLKPNCGCTVPKLEKYDFEPGESGKITVKFNSTGRRGSQQKSIIVFSNDPSAPTQSLIIKAKVKEAS